MSSHAVPAASPALADRLPPHVFFLASAVFHYLGPAFAVLLFAHVAPLGVAWLRIATAALIFSLWRKPWRAIGELAGPQKIAMALLGLVLAAMNCCFYEAIDRLPLGTVGAIEFLGPIGLAAFTMRGAQNMLALLLAASGVFVLTDARILDERLGYLFAFLNCALFLLYILLGHRIARDGGKSGIDRLSAAMAVAMVAALPIGIRDAAAAFTNPLLLAAAVGVGVTSSVIPYVCDQLAMARLPRSSFALMLSLLPATAVLIGMVVLRQMPSAGQALGVGLVVAGVAVHRPR